MIARLKSYGVAALGLVAAFASVLALLFNSQKKHAQTNAKNAEEKRQQAEAQLQAQNTLQQKLNQQAQRHQKEQTDVVNTKGPRDQLDNAG